MKHRAWNKYNKSRNEESWNLYIKARNYATFQVKIAKYQYEKKIAKEIKKNPKCFWKMVRDKTRVKVGIPNLITKEGEIIQGDKKKTELFNSFFVSVLTKEDKRSIPSMEDRPFQKLLEDIEFDENKVRFLLGKLKINKSPGPDQIHNKVLFETRNEISNPLTVLFRQSLDFGILPDEWKIANITPIYKKRKKSDPNNYRPVSLPSAVGK